MLKDKQYKDYNRVSRYSPFPYYYDTADGNYVYGTTRYLKQKDTPFVSHTVKSGDTYDSLALYYYNNPTYFWVIADFNRVNDPYTTPKAGSVIKIPTFSAINYDFKMR